MRGWFESRGGDAWWDGHGGRMMVITIPLPGGTLAASSLASRMMCIWHVEAGLYNRWFDILRWSWVLFLHATVFSFMSWMNFEECSCRCWCLHFLLNSLGFRLNGQGSTVPGQIQSGQANHRWQRLQHEGGMASHVVSWPRGPRYLEAESDPARRDYFITQSLYVIVGFQVDPRGGVKFVGMAGFQIYWPMNLV